MGTRGALGFRLDGKDYVTYNHWDSYPEGLGQEIVDWLKTVKLTEVKAKVKSLTLLSESDKQVPPTEEQKNKLKKYADLSVSARSLDDWYCLLRNTQGDPDAILKAGYMMDGSSFLADSLFCEWAYIVNLDEKTFEVYKGFQDKKHNKGRYASMPKREEYYPVALVGTFPLAKIPNDWIETVCPPEDED